VMENASSAAAPAGISSEHSSRANPDRFMTLLLVQQA
jgi:hypothetical protein